MLGLHYLAGKILKWDTIRNGEKLQKKMRRRKIRKKLALERIALEEQKEKELSNCPQYQAWLIEQERLEQFTAEEEGRVAREAQLKWEAEEMLAQQRWLKKQELAKKEVEILEKQQALIRQEWEKEQEAIETERKRKEREEQIKKEEFDKLREEMDSYIRGETKELPCQLNISTETQPGREICPFFQKVGACRFKDVCSRNHIRPGLSRTLLFPGFYSHFSLTSVLQAEYDTDIGLEYNHFEMYKDFKIFYEDIKQELEKFGDIIQLKVCTNEEPHLRGNVYVEYSEERAAMSAFCSLNGRYYAGKRLSIEFTDIPSWKNAICGLQFKKQCPKGKMCNFLHVFRNPHGEYSNLENRRIVKEKEWKWSDSGSDNEESVNVSNGHRIIREQRRNRSRRRFRSRSRKRTRSRSRKRSRSKSSSGLENSTRKKNNRCSHKRCDSSCSQDKIKSKSSKNGRYRSSERKTKKL